MTDPKRPSPETGGQSDSTVMLRIDDVVVPQTPSTEASTEDFPSPPPQADATLMSIQLPVDDEFVPPDEPQPQPQPEPKARAMTGSRAAVLRRAPPVPAAAEPSPFAPAPAVSPFAATQEMGTFDEGAEPGSSDATLPPINRREPPRRATGVRAAIPEPSAAPPQAKRATGMRAAIPEPSAAPPQAKRATGMRPAIPEPSAAPPEAKRATGIRAAIPAPAPDPEAASSTVMFNTSDLPSANPEGANSTVLFSAIAGPAEPARSTLETDDRPTAAKSLAGDDRPTATKRPLAGLVDGPLEDPDTQPGAKNVDPLDTALGVKQRTTNGMQLVTAGLLLLVAGAVVARYVVGNTHKPTEDQLILMYPFGPQGQVLPSGRPAPPAKDATFEYLKTDDCNGYRCLTYRLRDKGGGFDYQMVVRSNDEDLWTVVSSKPSSGER